MACRWMVGLLVVVTGCVAMNPAYGDTGATDGGTDESSPTSDTKDPEPTKGEGSTTQGSGTSGGTATEATSVDPMTHGATSEDSSDSEPATTGPKFDLGEGTSDETGAPGLVSVVWLSEPQQGNFASNDEVHCDAPPKDSGSSCADDPVMLVGTSEAPLASLPSEHAFLAEGRLYAAGSGTVVADDYGALVEGTVTDEFVHALTGDAKQLELSLWWGPRENMDPASCDDWMASIGTASVATFVAGSGSVLYEGGPCSLTLPVLCSCRGEP